MNCHEASCLAALAASDDVTAEERSELQQHLATCAACRTEAAAFADLLTDIAELRDDPVPRAACIEVRSRVMEQLTRRRRWWLWPAAAMVATAAAVCALWIALLFRPVTIAPVPVPPNLAAQVVPAIVSAPAAPARFRHIKRAPKRPEPATEPLVVKMFTDDPQVVMYWIVEGKESNQ